jgi:hypothetical protein
MAVLVVNMSYPTEQAEAVTKRFQEILPKFPPQPDVTMRGPYWSGDIEKGIKGLSIVEVEGSKINQARSRLAAFCNACHGIPGLKWSIEIWAEQADLQERREKYGY